MTDGPLNIQGASDAVQLAAVTSALVTAGTTTTVRAIARPSSTVQFLLEVTATNSAGTDRLNVTVQTELAVGLWADVCAFPEVAGNDSTDTLFEKSNPALGQAGFAISAALSAGTTRNIAGGRYRVKYVVAGGTASFDFNVFAIPV